MASLARIASSSTRSGGRFLLVRADEAVAQVASAVDVDVAHRVVVGPRKDREEVEVLRGSLHRVAAGCPAAHW